MRLPQVSASINVTPLVDVFLVLVAALILAAAMSTKPLPVQLPETGLSGAPVPRANLVLALDKQGRLLHAGEEVTAQRLAALPVAGRIVELAPDRGASYEALAQAVDRLTSAGAAEVRLLTR